VEVAFTAPPPLERRVSIPRPDPSARQRARLAELSEWQLGLLRRSYGRAEVSALQQPLSFPSTLHSHSISQCGFPRSHGTEAVPAEFSSHRRGGSPHTRNTWIRILSYAAYGQSAGSA